METIEKDTNDRKEIAERIYAQFQEQIQELHDSCEQERKEREATEEELISILKNIANNIQDRLLANRKQR